MRSTAFKPWPGFALAAILFGVSSFSLAATTPFSQAFVTQHNPDQPFSNYFISADDNRSNPPSAAAVNLNASGVWGAAGGSASASLASGTLGGRVFGNLTGQCSGACDANNIYSQSNALFGDGFRSFNTNGTPFTWQSGTTARFGITIDGSLASSPALAGPNAGGAWVTLLLFQPDTLSPTGVFGARPNLTTYYHYLIGNPNLSVTSYGGDGVPDLSLLPTAYVGGLNAGPVTITQDFQPGGNFDWVLLLGAYANADHPGQSFDLDLAHTVTFSYEGPAQTTTQSVSGLFENYQVPAVPEPETYALMLAGLAAVGAAASRNRFRSTATITG